MEPTSRRTVLSGVAVALAAGLPSLAHAGRRKRYDPADDIGILNTALGAEHEAVAAYQLGAESGLLTPEVTAVATTFQGHHREHAGALAAAVKELGGSPVEPKAAYDFPTDQLASQADVLAFAASLERGAISAYVGAIPLFGERDLSAAAASILADEAMHWAVLRQALGEDPVPGAFFR